MTVERTIRFADRVDTIDEAFAFVVRHIDAEKMNRPMVRITPITMITGLGNGETETVEAYEVSVSTMNPLEFDQ